MGQLRSPYVTPKKMLVSIVLSISSFPANDQEGFRYRVPGLRVWGTGLWVDGSIPLEVC